MNFGFLDKIGKVPIRVYEYLGLVLLISAGVLFYNAHERAIGEQHLRDELEKAQEKTQEKIDAAAEAQNARIEAKFNSHTYTPIDYTLPANCKKVPDNVRDAVNKAHKR